MIFRIEPDGYRLADPARGIECRVDRLRRERGDLIGELSVTCEIAGARTYSDGLLSVGTFNVSSPRARQERARTLAARAQTNGDVDWVGALEELCQRTLAADRAGRPAVLLREVPRRPAEEPLDVEGLRLFRDHPVIWFGDGGTAKSYLALWVAGMLARRGLTVMIADWELSGEDHRDRLERLFGDDMPPVLYARCERPLQQEGESRADPPSGWHRGHLRRGPHRPAPCGRAQRGGARRRPAALAAHAAGAAGRPAHPRGPRQRAAARQRGQPRPHRARTPQPVHPRAGRRRRPARRARRAEGVVSSKRRGQRASDPRESGAPRTHHPDAPDNPSGQERTAARTSRPQTPDGPSGAGGRTGLSPPSGGEAVRPASAGPAALICDNCCEVDA